MKGTADYVAFAFVFIAVAGVVLAAMSAINWWMAVRRQRRAGTLVATEGTLRAIEPRFVALTGKGQASSYWTVDAAYDYDAAGRHFTGDRFGLDYFSWLPDEATAVEAAARFKPGSRVTVWFDPVSPGFPVLDRTERANPRRQRTLTLLAGGVAVISAVAAAFVIAG